MPYTEEEQKQVHMKMYGVENVNEYTVGLMQEGLDNDYQSLAISMLSDVQALMELALTNDTKARIQYLEDARKLVNISKYLISRTRK